MCKKFRIILDILVNSSLAKNAIIILFISAIQFKSWSQNSDTIKNVSFMTKYSKGYIFAHHKSFKYFINNYVSSIDANICFRTKGNKIWHQVYKYPTIGLGFYFADLGNPDLLGNVNAIYPFISVPIIERKKFKLNYKFSEGIAWLNKKFDLYDNKYNFAIGSHLNVYLNLNLESEIKFANKTYLILAVGYTHYSNGGTIQPNKGFNIVTLQSGIKYKLNEKEYKIEIKIPDFIPKNEYSIILSAGIKNLPPARKIIYPISSLMINAKRQFSHKGKFGFGIDIFYDKSRIKMLKDEGIENPTNTELFYGGAHLSYDFIYGNMSFTTQMGLFLLGKARSFQVVYHRFGLSYKFDNNLITGIHLKTFWAAADFIEWGVGYSF